MHKSLDDNFLKNFSRNIYSDTHIKCHVILNIFETPRDLTKNFHKIWGPLPCLKYFLTLTLPPGYLTRLVNTFGLLYFTQLLSSESQKSKLILFLFQADVVCRQLGFSESDELFQGSHFGSVPDRFSYDHIECKGNEARLSDCPYRNLGPAHCGFNEGAGVRCE
jgi:hypothetical protein